MVEVAPENTAGVIYRGEPTHNGHMSGFWQVAEDPGVEKLVIMIGSSEASMEDRNPFNLRERKLMLERSLVNFPIPVEIGSVPDVGDNNRWVNVLRELSPSEFKIAYTLNPDVSGPLSEAGIEIRAPKVEYPICATDIRAMIRNSDDSWQDYVPAGVVQTIVECNGVDRIRTHFYKYPKAETTADVILDCGDGVALIKRKGEEEHGKWAILGGFLDVHKETVPAAATRELLEEAHFSRLITYEDWFRQFSDPKRDKRGHVIANVFHIQAKFEDLKAGDDAEDIQVFPWTAISGMGLAFDHNEILEMYMQQFKKGIYE